MNKIQSLCFTFHICSSLLNHPFIRKGDDNRYKMISYMSYILPSVTFTFILLGVHSMFAFSQCKNV